MDTCTCNMTHYACDCTLQRLERLERANSNLKEALMPFLERAKETAHRGDDSIVYVAVKAIDMKRVLAELGEVA
jgi:hypothetical protein